MPTRPLNENGSSTLSCNNTSTHAGEGNERLVCNTSQSLYLHSFNSMVSHHKYIPMSKYTSRSEQTMRKKGRENEKSRLGKTIRRNQTKGKPILTILSRDSSFYSSRREHGTLLRPDNNVSLLVGCGSLDRLGEGVVHGITLNVLEVLERPSSSSSSLILPSLPLVVLNGRAKAIST
jgi:hypothetical protein